jgi:hypothetical protein
MKSSRKRLVLTCNGGFNIQRVNYDNEFEFEVLKLWPLNLN